MTSRTSALTGAWGAPQRIAELSALGYNDSHPAIRGDGLEIYFLSRRGGGIDELWVSTRLALTAADGYDPVERRNRRLASSGTVIATQRSGDTTPCDRNVVAASATRASSPAIWPAR